MDVLFLYLFVFKADNYRAPLKIASLINFSPFTLFPLIAKNISFLTFLLLVESPEMKIFFYLWSYYSKFFNNILTRKFFVIYG